MPKIERKFSFMIHPLELDDLVKGFRGIKAKIGSYIIPAVYAKFPKIYERFIFPHIDKICKTKIFEITGIETLEGSIEGFFVAIPYTSDQIKNNRGDKEKISEILKSIEYAGQFAQENGAFNIGLGAYTSVITQGGKLLEGKLKIPLTTGNSFTAYSAIEAACLVAKKRGIDVEKSRGGVIGALGAVGSLCSCLIAKNVSSLIIVGKNKNSIRKLEELKEYIKQYSGIDAEISIEAEKAVKDCDIVISATSNVDPVINDYTCLKKNSVVADIARPEDISYKVIERRKDVFVLDAGLIEIPGSPKYKLDLGFPKGRNLACFSETVLNAAQGINENWYDSSVTLEDRLKRIEIDKQAMKKYGFRVATDYIRRDHKPVRLNNI
ncbi:hypothetical protein HZA33_02280 [Candidatus Pacearchaeota archaeon]|nr:hypothetical protein [Candidatus Pacearchaeota archaeon]